jgi:uncharacterized protein YcbK (DUF882 family)
LRRPHLRTAFWIPARAGALLSFGSGISLKLFGLRKAAARKSWFATAFCLSASCFVTVGMSSTESAIANGDTRTIRLYHAHTGESIEATYRVNGYYDPAVLEKLNWFLRDWRLGEATKMDPRLFDAVWEAYRGAGATEPITVVCGYRSPQTNAMLRARSRAVAEHSQHMLGKAMDTTMPGMSMEKVREVAMRLQMGGVGYYGSSNFVHIDVGGVRSWPRMNYDQLVRLFPDGKTVHIASNGQTLARYEEARAELQARGSIDVPPSSQGTNFFAWLFGGGRNEDEREEAVAEAPVRQVPAVRLASRARASEAASQADDAGRMGQPSDKGDKATDKTIVGSLVPVRGLRRAAAEAETAADAEAAPMPPHRPVELAALVGPAPVPPMRSEKTAAGAIGPSNPVVAASETNIPPKKDAIGGLIAASAAMTSTRAANLPSLITQGSNMPSAAPAAVLAYASGSGLEGLRTAARKKKGELPAQLALLTQPAPPMLPARLDRSNFLTMTGSVEAARSASQTVLGPTVTGLRQVAQNQLRLQAGALSNVAIAAVPSRFAVAANDLPADHFVSSTGTAYAANGDNVHVLVGSLALKSGE